MKKIMLSSIVVAIFALAGCGGGGGGSESTPTPLPEPVRLAPYIGSWTEGCDGHELATHVIARTSADTINFAAKSQYFANSGCTGAILGTETSSANVTMTYTGVTDSSVVLKAGSAAVPAKIDLVTVRLPQGSTTVTGPGVVHTVKDGQARWCITYSVGNSVCIIDDGVEPAQGPISAGLYATGNEMHLVLASGGTYASDLRLVKQ